MAARREKSDICWLLLVVCLGLLQQACWVSAQSTPVNVALNKPISAKITCGLNGSESFNAHLEILKPPSSRVTSVCDNSNPQLAHGPANMVDLESGSGTVTWWQSTSRTNLHRDGMMNPDTEITIDLQENYKIETIRIQMSDSVRPGQMSILKSTDGISFTLWQAKVSSLSECTAEFNVQPMSLVSQANTVLCTQYSLSNAQPRNEVITFTFQPPADLMEWQRARYVRFAFHNMIRSFGFFSDEYHHYTVQNIEVLARCECNGHASDCTLQATPNNPSIMTYQCQCGGNTQGMSCDQCLPFYNQLAYQTGESGFTCQACNCFGHSDVCIYDPMVTNSLNSSGNYNGGGVCQDCRNFTAGINCNQCQRFYFRPLGKQQTDEDACRQCNCNLPGTREDPSIGRVKGECIMNNDVPIPNGMFPGDCYCKVNVQGSKCQECKNGFYDLTDANSNGCLSCNCFTPGTVSASNTCNKNATGQCPCKTYTTGRRCNQCMDGFYGLAADNPEGCVPCSCDAGGSLVAICDKESGVCPCRNHVEGRQCDNVTAFSFYRTLHTISAEFETIGGPNWGRDTARYPGFSWYGYVTLTGQMSTTTTLSVPPSQLSGTFQIVLRVANEGATQVSLIISPKGATQGATQMGTVVIPLCPTWCFDGIVQNLDAAQGTNFLLGPGEWDVTVSIDVQGGAKILFDQVVAIPVEFSAPSALLGDRASTFTSTCNVYSNDMRLGTNQESLCLSNVFSLTVFYFEAASPCDCNPTGSITLQCNTYGGQCECKPGVGGRKCDMCLPEFYAYRSTGCTACDCYSDNKVCDMTTGQCDCPPNTAGQRCDRCVTFAWGLNSTTGCQLCNCDPMGSVNRQCDAATGMCSCQPGVGGTRCDQCLDGYQGMTSAGCTACQCDPAGSLGISCNKTTGQCLCKDLVGGVRCDSCAVGSFYNSPLHQSGCLQCVCMGITTVCISTLDKIAQYNVPTDAALLASWSVVSDVATQTPFPTSPTTSTLPINATDVVTVTVQAGQDGYWLIPTQRLGSNLLGLYGNALQFTLYYPVEGLPVGAVPKEATLYIKGLGSTFTRSLGAVQPSILQDFAIRIVETEFLVQGSGAVPDRSQFIKTLSAVDGIFVSASLSTMTHQSSIGRVSYFAATKPDSPNYDSQGVRALSVEQCSCGSGYSGYSCEECATGYHRINVTGHPYFGECIACNCNGHSETCDPMTGQCLNCSHNTTGSNCERCSDGFYGDATVGTANDCAVCPCSPPKAQNTSCSVVNGTLTCAACAAGHLDPLCDRCDAFHFGQPQLPDGFCTPCFCNGNSNQCNTTTGQCLTCGSQTTGNNCELCQDFTFGTASLQNCQACNCDTVGSSGSLCNNTNGQCPCKPGAGDRRCSTCLPNYYGFSPQGCTACSCNELGSTNLQCGADGVCSCQSSVIGTKCDQCAVGRYGLPQQACSDCDCDVIGSIGGATAICNITTGACPCKMGVGSRRCDQCLPVYVNFTTNGCSKCDQCVETLQNSTQNLQELWTRLWAQATLLNDLQQRDQQLETLRPQVNQTVTALSSTLASFAQLRLQIGNIDEQQFVTDVDNLVLQVGQAMEGTQTLLNSATFQLERLQALQTQAQAVLDGVTLANQTVLSYVDTLVRWNAMADPLPGRAQGRLDGLLAVTYDSQESLIRAELSRSQNVSASANVLLRSIRSQASTSSSLGALVTSAETHLTSTMQLVTSTHTLLNDVEATLQQVATVVTETEAQLNYSSQLLAESQALLQRADTMLAAGQTAIVNGSQAFIDAGIIRQGSTDGTGVPIDPSIDQRGQNGWLSTYSAAQTQKEVVSIIQPTIETIVLNAETHITSLTTQSQESNRLLATAPASSQDAVNVIKRYQDVVSAIAEANLTSRAASTSMATTLQSLALRNLTVLQSDGRTSKEASAALLNVVNGRTTDTAALERSLQTANETLSSAEALWDTIAVNHMTLVSEASALSQTASDPQIQPAIDQGLASANQALATSQSTLNSTQALNATLADRENDIGMIQETIANTTNLLSTAPALVSGVEAGLTTLAQKTNTLTTLQNETSGLRSALEVRMASLREKLRSVQDRIANTKQPTRFPGQTSLEIQKDSSARSMLSNEVQLDFKADTADGLVFFIENTAGQYFSIEVVSGKVEFTFNVNQEPVSIQSPIQVCCGDWFRVLGTRYANEGHLSVVKLSTGGASVSYNSSAFAFNKYFSFPANKTSFYVGGLPSAYQTGKVRSRGFAGCIADVRFDQQELDLWRPTSQEGSTSCCPGAVVPAVPEPDITPGISFSSSGYYQIPVGEFNVYQGASMSLEFQTALPESVLLIVTRPDLISYIGIFMVSGKVMFEMNTAGNTRYILESLRTYNDARWYRVDVAYNTSHYSMNLRYTNQTDVILESFELPTLAPLSFPNLRYAFKLFLGSPDPTPMNGVILGPTNLHFAGCMRNVMLSNGTTSQLILQSLTNTTAVSYQGVSFDGCRANIAAGVGFSGDFAYAKFQLSTQLARTQSLSFLFKTFQPHGILAYSYGTLSFNKLFYIALYHGNVFVQYNIGEGLSEPLQTVGLRLNTGQWQNVTVQFTGLSASLKVNDLPTIYSMRHLPRNYIDIEGSSSFLFVGGVPSSTPVLIGGEFPVRRSLTGAIIDFKINSLSVNFNDASIVLDYHGLDLSGVSPPVSELPPLPYPTLPAPTGSPPPATCSNPIQVTPYPSAARFGATANSYQAYQLPAETAALFQSSFVIDVTFRAVSPNGILFYAANSATRPTEFMGLLMMDGRLSFNITTSSNGQTNNFFITTNNRYDNGQWQKLTILRINDFAAVYLEEAQDYVNNGVQSNSVTSSMTINTPFYLGGIGPEVAANLPLTVSRPFDGCIRKLEVKFGAPSMLKFDLSNPSTSVGVRPCSMNPVELGGFFDGTGWLLLRNNFQVGSSLDIQVTIRTSMQNALLLAVSANEDNFLALDIYDGMVRAIISHGHLSSYIVRSTTLASDFAICDNTPHVIRLSFIMAALRLTVDDNASDVTVFDAGTPNVATNNGLYIGGIPNTATVPLISGISAQSFSGCMQNLLINNSTTSFRDNQGSVGFITGCPLKV